MIVLGLNQTLDRTIRLTTLTPGAVMRTNDVTLTAGGKAVNAARSAHTLGHPCRLIGPWPGVLGNYAAGLLKDEGLDLAPIEAVDGEIRGTTITIETDRRATVINEAGPPLRPTAWEPLIQVVTEHLTTTQPPPNGEPWLIVAGSAPPGTPTTADADLIEIAHKHGWRVAIDATGERLAAAVAAGADLVSPNLAEATSMLTGQEFDELTDSSSDDVAGEATDAATALVKGGARHALVSAGRHGVAAADREGARFEAAPQVTVVNPIGAGDSLLGATVVALERGLSFAHSVREGVAYAAASVSHRVAGYADLADYQQNLETINSNTDGSGGQT